MQVNSKGVFVQGFANRIAWFFLACWWEDCSDHAQLSMLAWVGLPSVPSCGSPKAKSMDNYCSAHLCSVYLENSWGNGCMNYERLLRKEPGWFYARNIGLELLGFQNAVRTKTSSEITKLHGDHGDPNDELGFQSGLFLNLSSQGFRSNMDQHISNWRRPRLNPKQHNQNSSLSVQHILSVPPSESVSVVFSASASGCELDRSTAGAADFEHSIHVENHWKPLAQTKHDKIEHWLVRARTQIFLLPANECHQRLVLLRVEHRLFWSWKAKGPYPLRVPPSDTLGTYEPFPADM